MVIQAPNANHPQKPWSALQKAASELGTAADGTMHLDGVRWDIENGPNGEALEQGVFSDLYVNPDKVKDVFLCIKPFEKGKADGFPGHALLKFEMQPDAPVRDSQGQQDSAMALSVEVHFRQGGGYDPAPGDEPQPIMYQLGTWTDAIEKATLYDHYPLQIYKLSLNQQQKVDLLRERLHTAALNHDQDIYHPIDNSCLSTLIDGVNQVVPPKQQISHSNPNAQIPVWCHKIFRTKGLLAQDKPDLIPAIPKR